MKLRNRIVAASIGLVLGAALLVFAWSRFRETSIFPWLMVVVFLGDIVLASSVAVEVRRERRRANGFVDGFVRLKGKTGIAVTCLGPDGKIRVQGEIWDAQDVECGSVLTGTEVLVVGVQDGRRLIVQARA